MRFLTPLRSLSLSFSRDFSLRRSSLSVATPRSGAVARIGPSAGKKTSSRRLEPHSTAPPSFSLRPGFISELALNLRTSLPSIERSTKEKGFSSAIDPSFSLRLWFKSEQIRPKSIQYEHIRAISFVRLLLFHESIFRQFRCQLRLILYIRHIVALMLHYVNVE